MNKRARSQEAGVPLDYLKRIHEKHEEMVAEMANYTRVLIFDWNFLGHDMDEVSRQIDEIARERSRFLRNFRRL
jgi:hypothetical protein